MKSKKHKHKRDSGPPDKDNHDWDFPWEREGLTESEWALRELQKQMRGEPSWYDRLKEKRRP